MALLAALAGAATLLDRDERRGVAAMVAALVLAALAIAAVVGYGTVADRVAGRPAAAGVALVVGAVAVVALAWALRRRPAALALAVIVALPFRVPVTAGAGTANLLLPLYAVLAAGVLARLWGAGEAGCAVGCVGGVGRVGGAPRGATLAGRRVGRLEWALAAVLVLYALQSLYSPDRAQAVKDLCFFYVPFAVLFRLALALPWTPRLLRACFGTVVGLSVLFALVGFGEWATGRLLLPNAKVLAANDLKPYFRVNSLFFDPNIYGRFLALTMLLLAAALLWSARRRDVALLSGALALLWAGLVLSLSQSSFAALLVGLAVLAALRWRPWPVVALAATGAVAAVALVLLAPGVLHIRGASSSKALDRATSGRVDLLRGGVRLFAQHPAWGVGSGGFAPSYRRRERIRSSRVVAVSHTIPVTVAAEQGVIGLTAYAWLLVTAFAVLARGVRERLQARGAGVAGVAGAAGVAGVARAGVAAAFAGLLVHSLIYAAYLEDPLSWTLLAIGAALALAPGQRERAGGTAEGDAHAIRADARGSRAAGTPPPAPAAS